MYFIFWGREKVGRVESMERWRGLSSTTDCFAWGWGGGGVFLIGCFFFFLFSAGSFPLHTLPYCDGKEREERVGWKKVHGAIFAVGTKVCWNRIFIQFVALFSLAMLNQKFVSVRNILKLWHTVIWNSFPVAMFQGLLGLHYWYQLKEVLLFSWVDTAGMWIS